MNTILSLRSPRSWHLLAWLGLTATLLATGGCQEPKDPTVIRFVVPDGFSGPFMVTPGEAPDRVPAVEEHQVNTIHVPPSGLVGMEDTGGFSLIHTVQCVTESGSNIPFASADKSPPGVHIFPLYIQNRGDQYYIVGTYQERDFVWADGKAMVKLGQPIDMALPPEPEPED